jgi:hypothetical protein
MHGVSTHELSGTVPNVVLSTLKVTLPVGVMPALLKPVIVVDDLNVTLSPTFEVDGDAVTVVCVVSGPAADADDSNALGAKAVRAIAMSVTGTARASRRRSRRVLVCMGFIPPRMRHRVGSEPSIRRHAGLQG